MQGNFDWNDTKLWKQYGLSPDYEERLQLIRGIIPPNVSSLLDIGCGKGEIVNDIMQKIPGLKIIGADISEEALSFVHSSKIVAQLPDMPFPGRSFELVMCLQVLEHIPEKQYNRSVTEIERLASKYILIGVPYRENILKKAVLCSHCVRASNVDGHLRSYNRRMIKGFFSGFHLTNEYLCGVRQRRQSIIGTRINHHFKRYYNTQHFVCPHCGYTDEGSAKRQKYDFMGRVSGRITGILNSLSPLIPYWIIGLYRRTGVSQE